MAPGANESAGRVKSTKTRPGNRHLKAALGIAALATARSTNTTAARATGVTPKAIRLYEKRGLLPPVTHTPAGYRLFDSHHIDTLRFIRQARTLGLRLDDIADILTIRHSGTTPCTRVDQLLDQRLADIDTTITDLQHLRHTLQWTRQHPNTTATICPIIQAHH